MTPHDDPCPPEGPAASGSPRGARRRLGLPGRARPEEYLEPAYPEDAGPGEPPGRAEGPEPRPVPVGPAGGPPGPEPAASAQAAAERPVRQAAGTEPTARPQAPSGRPAPRTAAPEPSAPEAATPETAAPEAAATGPTGQGDGGEPSSPVRSVPLRAALEAVLMVVDEPVTEKHLAEVLERPRREVGRALRELAEEYTAQERGFELRFVAGGWRFYTRASCAPAVDRFVLDGQQARLTQAALETLAVVAYRQPVSRSRVSAVRGVNCDGVMRTLVQRGLVEEAGSEPETGATLYRTTNYFLERMGLRGLEELPELAPFLPEAEDVEADSQEGSAIAEAVAAAGADAE